MTLGFMYNVQISQWVGIPSCRNRNQGIIKISCCLLQLWLFMMVSTKTEPLSTISTQLFHHFSFNTQVNVYKPLTVGLFLLMCQTHMMKRLCRAFPFCKSNLLNK